MKKEMERNVSNTRHSGNRQINYYKETCIVQWIKKVPNDHKAVTSWLSPPLSVRLEIWPMHTRECGLGECIKSPIVFYPNLN